MSPIGQILLLFAISALFLIPGARALICAHCIALTPGGPCNFRKCFAGEGMICTAITTFKDDMLVETMLSCAVAENVQCGTRLDLKTDLLHETKCCDTDFCNADYHDKAGIPSQASGLTCAHCVPDSPEGPCNYRKCTAGEGMICTAVTTFRDDMLVEKALSCAAAENVQCGTLLDLKTNLLHETKCCDTNFCNADYDDRAGIPPEGPNSLLCAQCVAVQPGGFCHFKGCRAPAGGMCIATIIQKDGKFFEKMLSCAVREHVQCGVHDGPEEGLVYDTKCCNHFNYCNADY